MYRAGDGALALEQLLDRTGTQTVEFTENAEKSTYKVSAEADVKGAALDPSDEKEIKLV